MIAGDPCFSASQKWPEPILQWGPKFTCTIPDVKAGTYLAVFTFAEPTVQGPGLRVFTISYGGFTSAPIDLWAMGGYLYPVMIAAQLQVPFPGPVVITFAASVRNAVVASITLSSVVPPLTQGMVFVSAGDHVVGTPCPAGWTGPALGDGSCITIFFSQRPPGVTTPARNITGLPEIFNVQ